MCQFSLSTPPFFLSRLLLTSSIFDFIQNNFLSYWKKSMLKFTLLFFSQPTLPHFFFPLPHFPLYLGVFPPTVQLFLTRTLLSIITILSLYSSFSSFNSSLSLCDVFPGSTLFLRLLFLLFHSLVLMNCCLLNEQVVSDFTLPSGSDKICTGSTDDIKGLGSPNLKACWYLFFISLISGSFGFNIKHPEIGLLRYMLEIII